MRQIADLHIHSRFSRACSRELKLENIDQACRVKGVDMIATGDFTFPDYFAEIEEELEELAGAKGLYKLKKAKDDKVKFVLATELALIYKKGDKARRIHICVQAPNVEAVRELNDYLDRKFNIRSDGRPILGMSSEELAGLCLKIHPEYLVYPAHIWTPWFAVFGSKSGFDTLEECFGKETENIHAYETGLSSDPEMNWRVTELDSLTLLSNSDAHSLPNIAREANVFELAKADYSELYQVIKNKYTKDRPGPNGSYLDYTIEFYPEEGMYHLDGHRDCGVRFEPAESKRHKGLCPKCKKPLVIGVMNRVDELSDRPSGTRPENAPGYKKLVELDKIIAEALGIKSRSARKVQDEYKSLTGKAGTEMAVLLDLPLEKISEYTRPEVAEGIRRVREGRLIVEPGFDGQYGVVRIFSPEEKASVKQGVLF